MLHVNPSLDDCGMLVVYNSTGKFVSERLKVNVYDAGLRDATLATGSKGDSIQVSIERVDMVELK
jgi:hypothetical protein